jgi:predicted DsbA family dithiol-disulfide isomerase
LSEASTTKREVLVEIWSDLICPWCAIGLRRFEKALADFPGKNSVRVVHHAFRLAPGANVEPVSVVIPRKYGLPPAQAATMFRRVEDAARGEGMDFHLEGTLHGDTKDGHRLVQFAATVGLQHEVLDRLYRAYFEQGFSLFDRARLLDLVVEAGLDRARAAAVLESDDFTEGVEADQLKLQEFGVNGVPFFVVDERYGISGAQDPKVFAQALRQAWDEGAPVAAGAGEACDEEGCRVP